MILTPKQRWSVARANSRINIWEGSVRSGKTIAVDNRYLLAVGEERTGLPSDAIDIMVGKTLGSLKRNVINPIIEIVGSGQAKYFSGKQEFHLFGKPIHVFGVNDERSVGKIQGATIRKAYGDEIALWPEVFFKMMDSRMSTKKSQFFGTTNPGPPRHYLKTEYLDRKHELDLSSFFFCLDDNTELDESYKSAIKLNYKSGFWYDRYISGLWCSAEGQVYDCFDYKKCVIKLFPKAKRKIVAVDYGTTNPTCFILFGIDYNQTTPIWAEREYYYDSKKGARQKSDEEYADDFVAWLGEDRPDLVLVDPSAASFKVALAKKKSLPIRNAENEVLPGIRTQYRLLANGKYKIHESCKNTIAQYGQYVWDKHSYDKGEDVPKKEDDHTKDVERYALYHLEGKRNLDYTILTKE